MISELRREFATPYPLVTAELYLGGRGVVMTVQARHDLPSALAIVVRSGQAILLAPEAGRFFKKVEIEEGSGAVRRLRPAGQASPVVIDPLVRFGRLTVHGVSTERLWELFD